MKNYADLVASFDQLGEVKDLSVQRNDQPGTTANPETAPAEISVQIYSQGKLSATKPASGSRSGEHSDRAWRRDVEPANDRGGPRLSRALGARARVDRLAGSAFHQTAWISARKCRIAPFVPSRVDGEGPIPAIRALTCKDAPIPNVGILRRATPTQADNCDARAVLICRRQSSGSNHFVRQDHLVRAIETLPAQQRPVIDQTARFDSGHGAEEKIHERDQESAPASGASHALDHKNRRPTRRARGRGRSQFIDQPGSVSLAKQSRRKCVTIRS